MKQVLLTGLFFLTSLIGFGQCPTTEVILNTQSEVDSFAATYPGCTQLNTNITIQGSEISNLNGLSQLISVNGNLTIGGVPLNSVEGLNNITDITGNLSLVLNTELSDFSGLDNLAEIGSLFIFESNIQNFIGLESLETINSGFEVTNCNSLIDFSGLESFNSIGMGSVDELRIENNSSIISLQGLENLVNFDAALVVLDNDNLESLTGLNNITSMRRLVVGGNPQLSAIGGLTALNSLGGQISIVDNDNLVDISSLGGLQSIDGSFRIIGNGLLEGLIPLANIDPLTISFFLTITDNPNLVACDIPIVCDNFLNSSIVISIEDNAPGCNSIAEVEIECGIVDIPDNNFLNALLNYTPVIDTNGDDAIQFDEAEAFTGNLDVSNKTIFDFTGLEAFANITGFNGSENFMGGLSLKNNTLLTSVDFSDCPDLEGVNLKNGNNMAITTFNGVNCPSLQFVCVDNVPFAEANFTNIDPQVQFVDDCDFLTVPAFNLEEAIVVFPNPVSENLNISVVENFSYIKAEVYSVTGQKLKETSANQINMSDLTSGIYFVKVISEVGSITKKIVKH